MIGRSADQYKNGVFVWFTGKVEDISDPQELNRVKVRCFGFYDDSVNVSDLPWATVMMPTTMASITGNGGNHHLEVGSWVVGFFRDGPSAQDPIVMGSIATQTDGTKDLPTEASNNNKVYKSKAGHLIEIDNTSNSEKLSVTHAKGAKITIDSNNNITITNSGRTSITSDSYITINSKVKTIIV